MFSEKYIQMIHSGIATMLMYQKDVVIYKDIPVEDFKKKNSSLIKRVFDEILLNFNYELSNNQMDKICFTFINSTYHPSKVSETKVFKYDIKTTSSTSQ